MVKRIAISLDDEQLAILKLRAHEGAANMKEYNGHRSWNRWNALLWLTSDVVVDSRLKKCFLAGKTKEETFNTMKYIYDGQRTRDGTIINTSAIKELVNDYYHSYDKE